MVRITINANLSLFNAHNIKLNLIHSVQDFLLAVVLRNINVYISHGKFGS